MFPKPLFVNLLQRHIPVNLGEMGLLKTLRLASYVAVKALLIFLGIGHSDRRLSPVPWPACTYELPNLVHSLSV